MRAHRARLGGFLKSFNSMVIINVGTFRVPFKVAGGVSKYNTPKNRGNISPLEEGKGKMVCGKFPVS